MSDIEPAATMDEPQASVPENNPIDSDLESLLKEFDTNTQYTTTVQTPAKVDTTAVPVTTPADFNEFKSFQQEYYRDKAAKELDMVVAKMSKDVPELSALKADVIKDIIDGEARRDERLVKAYQQRNSNPAAWDKVQKQLGQKIATSLGITSTDKASKQVNQNRAAVAAALGSASLSEPADSKKSDLTKMNDAQFRAWERANGITV